MTADLAGTTAVVTGASRGFGRAISIALHGAGAAVVGVARGQADLAEAGTALGGRFTAVAGDATDPELAADLLATYRPRTLVLGAGWVPVMAPLDELSWATFSRPWEVDVRHVFEWTRAALRLPLEKGSVVVVVSSGAALRGSPRSGGYAGAKATTRFLAAYAADEAGRRGLDVRFATLLPQLTPRTGVGAAGVAGYAAAQGVDVETYVAGLRPVLEPAQVGAAVVAMATGREPDREYLLPGSGLRAVPTL